MTSVVLPRTDVHTHLVPELPDAAVGAVGLAFEGERLLVDGHLLGPADLYRPDRLAAWLPTAGLDRALVAIPPPLYRQGDDDAGAAAWAQALNDGLAATTRAYESLVPLGYLPLEQPTAALAEAERLVSSGWAGFTASAGARSVSLASPSLRPLWRLLAQANRPLLLHPGPAPDSRLDEFYLGNLLGNPYESGLAAAQLLLGGVLDDHPGLRVALVHCGGVLPVLLGRWQRGVDTTRPGIDRTDADLRTQARQLWVDCLAHDPAVLDLAVGVVGEEHVVIGSDWPFPMGTDDPVALVSHRGEVSTDQITRANAAAFLGEQSYPS
ncbi:amidohydrolase family protein [Phytoactinopolyspora limicola]|uniref:amidohydrolase family protein n=1 Tax=Phytoactinopolyspora limicola TaxID=2715536 RepID=UPI00140979E0|nr:amidohydrolase family protein [Phytoactinopolyspora limicola]